MTNFSQRSRESINPLIKLYFEILSRFHSSDYDLAFDNMGIDLQRIYLASKRFDLMTNEEITETFKDIINEITTETPF